MRAVAWLLGAVAALVSTPADAAEESSPGEGLTFRLVVAQVDSREIGRSPLPLETDAFVDGSELSPRLIVSRSVLMTGAHLVCVGAIGLERDGFPAVALHFDPEGARELEAMTRANTGRQIALLFDGQVLSAPHVLEPILGDALVTNGYSGRRG